jgi:hypothetical protein
MLSSHKADNAIEAHRIRTWLYDENRFQLSFLRPKLSVHEEHCQNQYVVIVSQACSTGIFVDIFRTKREDGTSEGTTLSCNRPIKALPATISSLLSRIERFRLTHKSHRSQGKRTKP